MANVKPKSNWKVSEFVAHGSNVNCLALSPSNGHMLATGGDDRRVNLWLVGKPNNIMSISGMTSPVQSVAFNNSENWIGAGSKSGVVKVFDLEENRCVRSISGHKAAVCSLDFHRYGDILASGSMDTNLKLWDVRRKGCIFTYKGHTEVIRDIQFSPDGKWVVSASTDYSIRIWDLSAGKAIADFRMHTGGVTSVQFHPKEFLMCSGSTDRTVKFYDLEQFKLVSETSPDSNGVRKVLFHSDGTALFAGTEESLKVYGWEPARTYDMLPLHWGKVDDMTISGEQLIAASYSQTNVSVWCIAIKHLRPFSGDTTVTVPSVPTSDPPPFSVSGRRQFEYEQQEMSSAKPPEGVAMNGEGESVSLNSSEEVNDEEGSPPSQIKEKERMELFAARQRLIRTPPKKLQPPFSPPVGEDSPPSSRQLEFNRVQHIPNFNITPAYTKGMEQVNLPPKSEEGKKKEIHQLPDFVGIKEQENTSPSGPVESSKQQNGSVLSERKLHQPHDPIKPIEPSVSISQATSVEPSKNMFQDFIPPQHSNYSKASAGSHSSESRTVGEIVTNHQDISQILKSRLATLKIVRAEWTIEDPKIALEMAVNSNNTSVLVDVLSVLHLKRTLWTLDMALIVLPELKVLMHSKYRLYVSCGCNIIKLILKCFGPVIKNNLLSPPQGGRDLQREERYDKCQSCHAHLSSLREEIVRIVKNSSISPGAKVIRERAVLVAFNALD